MECNYEVMQNLRKLLYAHGMTLEDAKVKYKFARTSPGMIRQICRDLGVDISVFDRYHDICEGLYGPWRFADNLDLLVKAKRLTQPVIAQKIGITSATLHGYLLGRRKPSVDALLAIADYFEVSTVDLLYGNPKIKWETKGKE